MKKHVQLVTRRRFLKTAGLGGVALAMGLPASAKWRIPGFARRKLRFVFYTDVHTRTEWETPLAIQRAAAAINARKPDFVIGGGDFITDGFQSSAETVAPRWDAYMRMHESIVAPIHPVLGNHDLVAAIPEDGTPPSDDPRAIFRRKFGLERTYRSFDQHGCHFVLLDSIHITGDELKYHGLIDHVQLEWLESDLAKLSKDTPLIVVTHIPLLTAFYEATQGSTEPSPRKRVIVNNREVLAVFDAHRPILVLQGHLHVEEMLKWRGTTFITGGAVCAKWWRGPWHGTEEGFGVVTIDGDRVEWRYVDYGWEAQRPA